MSGETRCAESGQSERANTSKIILYLWIGTILIVPIIALLLWYGVGPFERLFVELGLLLAIAFAATAGMSLALLVGPRRRERESSKDDGSQKLPDRQNERPKISKAAWYLWAALLFAIAVATPALWYGIGPSDPSPLQIAFGLAIVLLTIADVSVMLLYGTRRKPNESAKERNRRASRLAYLGLAAVVLMLVVYFAGVLFFGIE